MGVGQYFDYGDGGCTLPRPTDGTFSPAGMAAVTCLGRDVHTHLALIRINVRWPRKRRARQLCLAPLDTCTCEMSQSTSRQTRPPIRRPVRGWCQPSRAGSRCFVLGLPDGVGWGSALAAGYRAALLTPA